MAECLSPVHMTLSLTPSTKRSEARQTHMWKHLMEPWGSGSAVTSYNILGIPFCVCALGTYLLPPNSTYCWVEGTDGDRDLHLGFAFSLLHTQLPLCLQDRLEQASWRCVKILRAFLYSIALTQHFASQFFSIQLSTHKSTGAFLQDRRALRKFVN